jgi:septal ring factor EnvC (AmiA/AmiB activator)
MNCYNASCDEDAALEIRVVGETTTRGFCMQHGQNEKQRLDSLLVPYTHCSIVQRDPTESELLSDSYGQLQTAQSELIGLRAAVTRLQRDWNVADQERQAFRIERDRKAALVQELSTQIIAASSELDQVRKQLADANELLELHGITADTGQERVEGGEVKPLTSVDA